MVTCRKGPLVSLGTEDRSAAGSWQGEGEQGASACAGSGRAFDPAPCLLKHVVIILLRLKTADLTA